MEDLLLAGIERLVPGKDSSSATNPSGGGDDDPGNTCTRSVQPSDWTGQPASHSYAKDTNQAGDYEEGSDGEVTANLDITNYVGSDDTLTDLSVSYTGIAECDSDAASCSASATTTVTFSNGSSTTVSRSADTDTASREYEGLHETTDSNVTSTKVVNDSSASVTRELPSGPDAYASATGTITGADISWETTDSCN